MSLPAFRRTTFAAKDVAGLVRQLNEQAGAIVQFLKRLTDNRSLDFSRLEGVTLGAGTDTVINHKAPVAAGAAPSGWRLTDITGSDATVRRVAWDDRTITLHASAACVVALEVWP